MKDKHSKECRTFLLITFQRRAICKKTAPVTSHCSCQQSCLSNNHNNKAMKRFWQEAPPDLPSPDALDSSSASSAKRVRLSTSPGELRLEADMKNMPEWTLVDNRHLVSKKGGALFERQFRDSMTFVLYLSQHAQVWIEFPRMYPHEAPRILKVVHPVIQNVIVLVQPVTVPTFSSISTNTTIVYDQWSPVRRLDEFLGFLVDALQTTHHAHRALVTPTLMLSDEDEDMDMQEVTEQTMPMDIHMELSPNRFDRGYTKTPYMPRGQVERELMNSDSY